MLRLVDRRSGPRPDLHRRRRDAARSALDRPEPRRVAAAVRRRSRRRRTDRAARRRPYTVIGVMPRAASRRRSSTRSSGRRSASRTIARRTTGRTNIVTIAQLADGATFEQANAEIGEIVRDLARELPRTHQGWTGGILTLSGLAVRQLPRAAQRPVLRGARAAADRLVQHREPDARARDVAQRRAGAPPRDRRDAMVRGAAGAARDRDRQRDRRRVLAIARRRVAPAGAAGDRAGDDAGARRGHDGLARRAVRRRLRRRCRRSRPVSCRRSTRRTARRRSTRRRRGRPARAIASAGARRCSSRRPRCPWRCSSSGGVLVRAYFRTSHLAVGYDPSAS